MQDFELHTLETTGWKPEAQTIFFLILQRIAVFDPMEIR